MKSFNFSICALLFSLYISHNVGFQYEREVHKLFSHLIIFKSDNDKKLLKSNNSIKGIKIMLSIIIFHSEFSSEFLIFCFVSLPCIKDPEINSG